ncbi:MAG: hypothetical protein HY053_04620 [Proteobacteria bacterium]|nr:hypothetical protein [Pseudomonadota bacterium]
MIRDAQGDPAACAQTRPLDRTLLAEVARYARKRGVAYAAEQAENIHRDIDTNCALRGVVDGLKDRRDGGRRYCAAGFLGRLENQRENNTEALTRCAADKQKSDPNLADACKTGLKIQDLTKKICHATGRDRFILRRIFRPGQ